jgi:hypothetical protein
VCVWDVRVANGAPHEAAVRDTHLTSISTARVQPRSLWHAYSSSGQLEHSTQALGVVASEAQSLQAW